MRLGLTLILRKRYVLPAFQRLENGRYEEVKYAAERVIGPLLRQILYPCVAIYIAFSKGDVFRRKTDQPRKAF